MTTIAQAQQTLSAIRTLRQLGGDTPTDEQRTALSKWMGWGPLAQSFDTKANGGWADIADELESLFTENPADLVAGADVSDTSFYTNPAIVEAIFSLLRSVGFTGGRILEPGCGSGRFMSATPADMDVIWTGVESDPTSAAIAAALNPGATILAKPLQETVFTPGEFDAAIGNVPFSSATVFDAAYESSSLHEYFLIRALDAVRDGGYVIAVTSRFTMDSYGGLSRISEMADVMGAVRLPGAAFTDEGTDVTTDIVLLRRRAEGEARRGWDDLEGNMATLNDSGWGGRYTSARPSITEPIAAGRYVNPVEINAYWGKYPEHVAGQLRATGNKYNALAVISEDPFADVERAVSAVATHLLPMAPRPVAKTAEEEFADIRLVDDEGRKTGSFHLIGSGVFEVINGYLQPVARATKEIRALIGLKIAGVALVEAEGDTETPDSVLTPLREAALAEYTSYVATFGALNRGTLSEGAIDPETDLPTFSWRRPAMGGFRRDPDYVTVMALEEFHQESGEARPAAILHRRINVAPVPIERVSTAGEAIAVSLGEGRGIDFDRIGSLLGGLNRLEIIDALGEMIFMDPATGDWVLDRDYLSGNVRQKLSLALTAAELDPAYQRNVTALEAVIPADLGPMDIRASLGASWLTVEDVKAFCRETFGRETRVEHTPVMATWEVDGDYASAEATLKWGTAEMNPFKILDHGLNGKTPVVYDDVFEKGTWRKRKNQQQTLAAEEQLKAINERFSLWVWEDADRSARICTDYNNRFNSHVIRRHDGAHLTFPGMSENITLWDHQRNIIDRVVSSERVLCGHAVGAGKTLSILGSALTLRRFGLARKPLIAVPNHLLEQIAREAKQAYPTGRFLIATKEDLTKERRRLFAARCATGDWDAVVMTHQAFTSLPVDPDVERRWIEYQKSELRSHLSGVSQYGTKSKGVKAIARAVRSLDARLSKLRDGTGKEDQVRFDQLGIDYLAIDEAHMAKKLPYYSQSGFNQGSSKRATDLLLKINTLATKYPKKPIVALFTGTPWSNTIAETFVWQTYLQPERLAEAGVAMFDAWAANFIRYESRVEVSPDGSTFRMTRRPAVIQNVADLLGMLGDVADILSADQIGLERPEFTAHNIAVEPTQVQTDYMAEIVTRTEDIRSGNKQTLDRGDREVEDNMLLVCNDGRKIALDPALCGLDGHSPKVMAIAEKVAGIYHESKDKTYLSQATAGALQVVFSDLGTPHPGDSQTYGRVRTELIRAGVPATCIRWIHEAKTAKAREAMFASCRDGSVSVLLGSTETMGTGTNIQQRILALHHLDAPWRPSDMTQRDGRALRPGNLNPKIDIFRYVTQGSFDAYLWQMLERKARFIAQMVETGASVREVEDISETVLSYGEIKALAAGNPALMEQAEAQSDVKRLMTMRSVHQQGINKATKSAEDANKQAEAARAKAALMVKAEAAMAESAREPSASQLEAFIAGILENAGYNTLRWRGLEIRTTTLSNSYRMPGEKPVYTPNAEVTISMNYRQVGSFTVRRTDLRKKKIDPSKLILSELAEWAENVPAQGPILIRRALALEQDAADSQRAATNSVFSHQQELAVAIARLESLTASIEEMASEVVVAA